MNCRYCSADGAYESCFSAECSNPSCEHYDGKSGPRQEPLPAEDTAKTYVCPFCLSTKARLRYLPHGSVPLIICDRIGCRNYVP